MITATSLPFRLAVVWLFLIVLGVSSLPGFARAEGDSVSTLDAEMRTALSRLSADHRQLDDQYRDALLDLLNRAEVIGNAEKEEQVLTEARDFRAEAERDFENFPALRQLREVYENARGEKREQLVRSRRTVLKIYEDRFRMLRESLEESGDVTNSIQARLRLEEITEALEHPDDLGSLLALWKFRTPQDAELINDLELKREEGRYLLSSKRKSGSRLSADVAVRAPFEFDTLIATDSVNIRYYLDGRVVAILNWEVRPHELRIHDPRGGIQPVAIADQGYVEVNQLHRIQVQVGRETVRILVDGEFRGEISGSYDEVRGKPGVGPAFGSFLTLEKFEVRPLEE